MALADSRAKCGEHGGVRPLGCGTRRADRAAALRHTRERALSRVSYRNRASRWRPAPRHDCWSSSDSAASGRARRCTRSGPLPRSRSLPPALLGRRPQRARGDAPSRRSLSQSEQQPTAILRTVPAWSRAAARNGCGVRDLGPCGGSGPSPSPDLAIAHRVGLGPGRRAPRPPAPARRTGPAGIGGDQPATT
jgi:hypothetical protein